MKENELTKAETKMIQTNKNLNEIGSRLKLYEDQWSNYQEKHQHIKDQLKHHT